MRVVYEGGIFSFLYLEIQFTVVFEMATVQCARPGCVKGSSKKCSACLKESYCGVVCQKLD
jgi:hypothetical protein